MSSSLGQDFVIGLALFAGPAYMLIGLQKLIASWIGFEAWKFDIIQMDLYTAFVLCCSLLCNGAPYTFGRAWCIVVVACICEMQKMFGPLQFATELGSGEVPFRVALFWIMIHTPCHEIVRLLGVRKPVAASMLTALLMTLTDLTTDPLYSQPKLAGNVVMKLWHWSPAESRTERRVYGVPMSNFLWWWIVSFVATLLFETMTQFGRAERQQISSSRLWNALQCVFWCLNGVFFATLYDVPPGVRFTATLSMIVPSLLGLFRIYYRLEWKRPQQGQQQQKQENRGTSASSTKKEN